MIFNDKYEQLVAAMNKIKIKPHKIAAIISKEYELNIVIENINILKIILMLNMKYPFIVKYS